MISTVSDTWTTPPSIHHPEDLELELELELEDSPLADYLRDVEGSFDLPPINVGDLQSSNSATPPPPFDVEGFDEGVSKVDAALAERFKYLICSSGLLEKTQLHTHSNSAEGQDTVSVAGGTGAVDNEDSSEPNYLARPVALRPTWTSRWDLVVAAVVLVVALAVVFGLTGAVILCTALGLAWTYLFSDTQPLSPTLPQHPSPSVLPDQPVPPTSQPQAPALDALVAFLSESHNLDQSVDAALKLLSPRPDDTIMSHELRLALHRLTGSMTDHVAAATSALLPLVDSAELAVLGDMYDIPVSGSASSARHATYRAVRNIPASSDDEDDLGSGDRRTGEIWNHSTTPASGSAGTPGLLASALPHTPSRHSLPDRATGSPGRGHTHHLSLTIGSPLDPNDKFTKLPDRKPRLSKRASWSNEWSQGQSPSFPRSSVGHERRITEEVNDEEVYEEDSMSSPDSSIVPASEVRLSPASLIPPPRTTMLPFTPKRTSPLTQTSETLGSVRSFSPPYAVLRAPRSAVHSPRRSLHDIPYLPSPPSSSTHSPASSRSRGPTSRVPAPVATPDINDNRRSLHTMPYYPPEMESVSENEHGLSGVTLTRARSLPFSDLQRIRATASSSKSSRRSSFISSVSSTRSPARPTGYIDSPAGTRIGLGLPRFSFSRPRTHRTSSVSPLTLAGLKAAYLGVHLKRRRMACCLLGLQFDRTHHDNMYWPDVNDALQAITAAICVEREILEAARAEEERDVAAAREMAEFSSTAETRQEHEHSGFNYLGRGANFAPLDTREEKMLGSMDELQRTMARVWSRCEGIRRRIESTTSTDRNFSIADEEVRAAWVEVRQDVGGLLRSWERGRDALETRAQLDIDDKDDGSGLNEEANTIPSIPTYLRTWNDDTAAQVSPEEFSSPTFDMENSSKDDQDLSLALPPPGIDQVYEATFPPVGPTRPRSNLSDLPRAERIRLMREARERGIPIEQLAGGSGGTSTQVSADRAMRAVGEEFVGELKGVFGEVRRRKGVVLEEKSDKKEVQ